MYTRRPEDAHRGTKPRERVEPLDELAQDAQRPPRIGLEERRVGVRPAHQQLAILGIAGHAAVGAAAG